MILLVVTYNYNIASNFNRWILIKLFKEKSKDYPLFDKQYFLDLFKALSKASRGRKPTREHKENIDFFNKMLPDFIKLLPNYNKDKKLEHHKLDSTNLSFIYQPLAEQMAVSIENNVKMNFEKYVKQYVNCVFIKKECIASKEEILKMSESDRINYYNKKDLEDENNEQIKEELVQVKKDIMECTFKSDKKYFKFIKELNMLLPKIKSKLTHVENISINSNHYIVAMMKMVSILEKQNKKMFQCMPIRTNLSTISVPIDTFALKDIFNYMLPRSESNNMTHRQIWDMFFNIEDNYKDDYTFNFSINTNGYKVSIIYIHKDELINKQEKSKRMVDASIAMRQMFQDKTDKEISEIKKQIDINKQQKKEENALLAKKKKKELAEAYKKLPDEEKDKIKQQLRDNKNKGIQHLEDLIKDAITLQKLRELYDNDKIVIGDTGSKNIMTLYGVGTKTHDEKGIMEKTENEYGEFEATGNIIYFYRNRRRLYETKRLHNNALIDNRKHKMIYNGITIKKREEELSNYSSTSVDLETFSKYLKLRLKLLKDISDNKFIYQETNIDKKPKRRRRKNRSNKGGKNRHNRRNRKKHKLKHRSETSNSIQPEFDISLISHIKHGYPTKPDKEISFLEYLHKRSWHSNINKKRHESKIMNEIEKIYGKDAFFIIGDGGQNTGLRGISTPVKSIPRMILKRFNGCLYDEFRSSALNWLTDDYCSNLKTKILDWRKPKKIHSVLTFKMGSKIACVQRDVNACRNGRKNIRNMLYNGCKLNNFNRSIKPEQVKTMPFKHIQRKEYVENSDMYSLNLETEMRSIFQDRKRYLREKVYEPFSSYQLNNALNVL